MKIKSLSSVTIIALMLVIFVAHLCQPRYKYEYYTKELSWDVFSYYMYLPFTFIYDDPAFTNKAKVDEIFEKYKPSDTYYQAYQIENGNWVPNYTLGFAILHSPFFLIGHCWAKLSQYPADGFSFPYQFAISTGVYFYIFLGLFYLRKLLLKYFKDKIVAIVILFLAIGTNYFCEAVTDNMQPHAMLFAGYAMFVYFIARWHETPKIKYAVFIGLLGGLMILCRPSEIVCVFLPILWNVYDRQSLIDKLGLIRTNFKHVLVLIAAMIIPFIPQFIFWKYATGSFVYFSYQRTEGFDLLTPHLINVLFSIRKSVLVYTPMFIFFIAGLFIMRRAKKEIFTAVFIYFLANFYLLSSWAAWWNGGSFGMRYFVESYAVLAIGFGFFIERLASWKWTYKVPVVLIMLFFVVLNIFQTWQFVNWIISDDRMTLQYYKRTFFKMNITEEDQKYREVNRSYASSLEEFNNPQDYDRKTITYFNFSNVNSSVVDISKIDTTKYFSKPSSFKFTGGDEWGPNYRVKYTNVVPDNKDYAWIELSLKYYSEEDISANPLSIVISMPHRDYQLKYRSFDLEKKPFVKGEWNTCKFYYMTPFPYSKSDDFVIYIWHRGKSDMYIDDFQAEVYTEKFDKKYWAYF